MVWVLKWTGSAPFLHSPATHSSYTSFWYHRGVIVEIMRKDFGLWLNKTNALCFWFSNQIGHSRMKAVIALRWSWPIEGSIEIKSTWLIPRRNVYESEKIAYINESPMKEQVIEFKGIRAYLLSQGNTSKNGLYFERHCHIFLFEW